MQATATFMLKHAGADLAGLQTLNDNALWSLSRPRLSIIAPAHKRDASPLIRALARCTRALEAEIIIYDDGSRNDALLAALQATADHALAAIRIVAFWTSHGRAAARNRAITHARSPWILVLEPDMAPDQDAFLADYMAAIGEASGPAVIVSGYSLAQDPGDPRFALHRWQSARATCIPAAERATDPARYVFSSNVLAHRDVLCACPFDETFTGWDWDDADWGLRAAARFPVRHIDNTVTHLGLDADEALMTRYSATNANRALMAQRHPAAVAATPLHRAARLAQRMPFRPVLKSMTGAMARTAHLPIAMRGQALTLWRALGYRKQP
jgi:Glycosyl transferase family 2